MADKSKPWIEKYRPKTIDDVAAQEHTIKVLRKQLGNANVCFLFKSLYTLLCFLLIEIVASYVVLWSSWYR